MASEAPLASSVAEAALAYAIFGRKVVPVRPGGQKRPYTAHGFKDASSDPDQVRRWWRQWPDANIGGVLMPGEVVIDVDDVSLIPELDLPETAVARTGRGAHYWYRWSGPPLSKTVLRRGVDRLVADSGYVVLPPSVHASGRTYEWVNDDIDELAELPAWAAVKPARESVEIPTEDAPTWGDGERNVALTSYAGSLRRAGATPEELLAALIAANHARCKPPLPPEEVARIAVSSASWERGGPKTSVPLAVVGMRDLLAKDIPPLRYAVDGLLPEGLALLVAAPKIGKSWLASQACVAVAVGGELLGRRATRGDALYLALEDGERRAQSRARLALDRMGYRTWPERAADLDIAFNAERGDAMVSQVESWLAAHPTAVLVVIDVLQKVRPVGSGKRNQYELDAEDVGRVLEIAKRHPGLCVLVVHHDRKQQANDFLDTVSGTHGISGSVDTVLVIRRDRHSDQARIEVTGRDVDEDTIHVTFEDGYWVIDPDGGITPEQLEMLNTIRRAGPLGATALGETLGVSKVAAYKMAERLVAAGMLAKVDGKYSTVLPSVHSNRRRTEANGANAANGADGANEVDDVHR